VLVLEVLAWIAVGSMVLLLVTQLTGWSGSKLVVTLQAASPYLLILSVPIAVAAIVASRWPLAVTAVAVAVVFVAMCWRLLLPRRQPLPPTDGRPLRVFHGNLLYYNGRTAEVARTLAALDVDIVAFTEYTQTHAGGFSVAPFAERFPHRIEHPEEKAGGSAMWSRYPLTEIAAPPATYLSSAAVIATPDPVTLYVVHPPNPLVDLDDWLGELAGLAALSATATPPAIVVGDLNATYWHPPFRRLLGAGWRDAHQAAGRGFSCSWPADRSWLRPFLRLDHALVDRSFAVASVTDVDLAGSDHHGLVVEVLVTPSAQAAREARSRRLPAATDGSSTASSPPRAPSDRTPSPGSTVG
jgi:endonuclease/exonuclease/phosphatase (EEP) superfamily protein YafD